MKKSSSMALLLACLAGCAAAQPAGKDVVLVQAQADSQPLPAAGPDLAQQAFGVALADLGLHLLRTPGAGSEPNALVSPFGVANALGLLHAGAANATAAEIAGVLEPATVGGRRLRAVLGQLNRQPGGIAGGPGVEWVSGSRVWVDTAAAPSLQPAFAAQAKEVYQADGLRIDLGDSAAARGAINAWAGQRTQGKVTSLIPERGLAPNTRIVLTNVVWFKGGWAQPFNPAQTQPASFHNADGTQPRVPTMAAQLEVREAQAGPLHVIELPYAHPDFALLIALPPEGVTLGQLAVELDGSAVAGWMSQLKPARIDLRLPRFSVPAHSASLKAPLQAAGMVHAFGGTADFSPMAGKSGLVLDDIYHAAGIDVDEHGTVATAATAAVARAKSVVLAPAALRKVDRPFLFVLLHKRTQTPLFIGRVSHLN